MPILLSGPVGSGKTTLCWRSVVVARERGIQVSGVLTPALVEGNRKVGIRAVDLRSGEERLLARNDRDLGGTRVGQYAFDDRTLDWMASLCEDALTGGTLTSGALVFVDEIGRLELNRGRGLARLIPLFCQLRNGHTVVLVRDTLLDHLVARIQPVVPRFLFLDAERRAAAWSEMQSLLFSQGWKGKRKQTCALQWDRITQGMT